MSCVDKTYYNPHGPAGDKEGDVTDKQGDSFIVRRKGPYVTFESPDKTFREVFTLNDPSENFWPFVEVRDLRSVTVKLLEPDDSLWESVTPNARVDSNEPEEGKGPEDVLDNT